jgi:hypothetical protein
VDRYSNMDYLSSFSCCKNNGLVARSIRRVSIRRKTWIED